MIFNDLFKETIWSLSGNKVRSGLTILGIVIGIASVITMVGIGQGAKNSVSARIESIGSNLIIVMPGSQRIGGINQGRGSAETLTEADAKAIEEQVEGIKAIAPSVTGHYQITAGSNNSNLQVIGTLPSYTEVRNVTVDQGAFFTEQQVERSAKVVVLGPTTSTDLFGENVDPTGRIVRVNKIDFQVIGVTKSKGSSGGSSQDDVAYVPLSTAQHYLSGTDYVNNISVTATDQNEMTAVQESISTLLLSRHKITDADNADFNIMNQSDILETASSITSTFTLLLSSIAGISLLVGGIGIMNMMLTTVTERTREIGLRKAVGVRKIYINLQFLSEAVVLTFLGGFIGVILGWLASKTIAYFYSSLSPTISLSAVLLAFGVSAGVGIVFGFYPARRAANLSPIEALRYE